jgi:hypothetical protein
VKKNVAILTASVLILFSYNCQVKETLSDLEGGRKTDLKTDPGSINLVLSSSSLEKISAQDKEAAQQEPPVVARISKQSCSEADGSLVYPITLELPFHTAVEQYSTVFKVKEKGAELSIHMGTQDPYFIDASFATQVEQIVGKVCQSAKQQDSSHIALDNEGPIEQVKSILERVAPTCTIDFSKEKGTFSCKTSVSSPNDLSQKLRTIQSRMIHWRRQPYLLTRKIAIGLNLIDELLAPSTQYRFSEFCNVSIYALEEELPFVLSSKQWRKKLCEKAPAEEQTEVAMILLAEIVKESEKLADMLEDHSALGTLRLRVSSNQIPSRELWVNLTLKTMDDNPIVSDNFATEEAVALCWHPIYSMSDKIQATALNLRLLDPMLTAKECKRNVTESFKKEVAAGKNHIISNISSETEFPIKNGRSIMLRLPKGDYEYEISSQPVSISGRQKGIKSGSIKGTMVWKGLRPSQAIGSR